MLESDALNSARLYPASDAESVTVTVPVAAHILGVTRKAVYHMVRSGSLPCVRIGGYVRLRRDVLDAVTRGATA